MTELARAAAAKALHRVVTTGRAGQLSVATRGRIESEILPEIDAIVQAAVAAERHATARAAVEFFSREIDGLGIVEQGEMADKIVALRAPGPPVATMLNTPITEAERDRISKDGP